MANDSYNYTLKDRMAARRADKEMAGATNPTPAQNMQPAKSALDASPTPGLDAQQQSQKRETFAEAEARGRRERTLAGAFGERAQKKEENLQGRKALYRDMQTVGGANISGSMRARANQLGVPQSRFDQVAGTLPAAPAMIAKPGAPTLAGKYGFAKGSATAAAPTPAAPLTGSALAQKNIAEKGIQGAAADYFQRRDNEMLAKQQKQIDTAFSKPVEYAGAAASAKMPASPSTPSWKTPPPLTADIGKADVMPNKRTTRN